MKRALSGVTDSDDVALYLPAFKAFASALLDAEASELFTVCKDADGFQTALESEVAPRIIEGVLPDRSLNRVKVRRTDEVKWLSIDHDMDTDLIWEVGPDGTRRLARAEVIGVYAQHGNWENFMPEGIRFHLRWPRNNATVRAVLSQVLQQRVQYWAGQFQPLLAERPAPGERSEQETAPAKTLASWLATRLRERSWNKHDVERHSGPNHKTVQKILSGEPVRAETLNKLARALSNAPSSLKLPQVNLLDIPAD